MTSTPINTPINVEVHIERANDADAGELWTLQRAAFVDEAIVLGHMRIPPLTETLDEVAIAVREQTVLKATVGTRIVGTGRLRMIDGSAWIERLAIAPDMHRNGIGTALLRQLEAQVPAGLDSVDLHAAEVRPEAQRFYETNGYTALERVAESPGVYVFHYRRSLVER